MLDEESLTGGGVNHVVKIGSTVRRPTGPWTPLVHDLLRQVREHGFTSAPEPLGLDDEGREILTFLPGTVSGYPMTPEARSDEALVSAAKLLRRYHDATVGFAERHPKGWQLPSREPVEVVCHGDFAPHNCVLDGARVVGVIDFDTAHPGPRLWDVAYAVYRFAPLSPEEPLVDQGRRAQLFCDSYGLGVERAHLAQAVENRLDALVDLIRTKATAGHPAFARHLADGHIEHYLRDRAYVAAHRAELTPVFTRS